MKSTSTSLLTCLLSLSMLAAACSSSATADSATEPVVSNEETSEQEESTETTQDDGEESTTEPVADETNEADTSVQSATVTLSTGEVFELTPTSCENQNTDPNDLLNDEYVDLSARNDDGFRFQVLNARVAGQDPAPTQVELSGNRDENGVNPKISYIPASGVIEATSVTIDGRRVTGESTIDARFSSEKPFGEEVVATFEFNC